MKAKADSGWFQFKIADCTRTDFRPRAIGDPRGRAAVRASYITPDSPAVGRRSMTKTNGISAS
jgi:hypothetical protein